MVIGRQRRVARADFVAFDDPPVVRIEQRLEARERRSAESLRGRCRPICAIASRTWSSAIASAGAAFSVGSHPSQPWRLASMPRFCQKRLTGRCRQSSTRRKYSHIAAARHDAIAGEIGDLIPVGVVRRHEDHRVVRGTAAQRAGARIPDAVLAGDELRIASLLGEVAVVADEEVPAHRRVFGRERVKGRDAVVRGGVRRRIAAGLEDDRRRNPPRRAAPRPSPRPRRIRRRRSRPRSRPGWPARAARPRRRRSTT